MAQRTFNRRGGWTQHNPSVYRSGLEESIAKKLQEQGVPIIFEQYKIPYVIPASDHVYTPDLILPNGIIIEAKGLFEPEDRKKHLLIKEQYPQLDIRFIFSNPKQTIYKGSKTTYGAWCTKYGFLFAHKFVPEAWLKESKKNTKGLIAKKKGEQ
ncbi:hypothetical protein SPFL3102_03558 [Sporomusaceae bacterium FL31]|nr:hypothetical protein SPFL3101_00447 [Sporomusaceae bacterium FL31]GCE35707.1 hypothetical protein SPFL3102_03558 [Sporomusaceae bacterium]